MQSKFVDELKNRISILDIISAKVKLKRMGNSYTGICPFHNEKTPSFNVVPEKEMFYCFGCGAHGDIITFVMKYENYDFKSAIQFLANRCGLELPTNFSNITFTPNVTYDILDFIKNFYVENFNKLQIDEQIPHTNINPKTYLKSRNITDESIQLFEIGFANNNAALLKLLSKNFSTEEILQSGVFFKNDYGNLKDRFFNRLIFPIIDSQNRCVGFGGRTLSDTLPKYLNSPETQIFIKNKLLYGYNIARKKRAKEIIVCEGYLDVISMHQAGIDGAVSTSGTSLHEAQMQLCWHICNTPTIALDGDLAGIKAAYRWIDKILVNLSPGKSFKFALMPDNCDPDDMVRDNRINELQTILQNAIPCVNWLMKGAFDLHPHSTPEELSYIFKIIEEKINLINDFDIKKFYRNFVFEFKKQSQKNLQFSSFFEKNGAQFNANPIAQNLYENSQNPYNNDIKKYHNQYEKNNINKYQYDPTEDMKYEIMHHNQYNKNKTLNRINEQNKKKTAREISRFNYQLQQILLQPKINKEMLFKHILIVLLVNNLKILDDVIEDFVTIEYTNDLKKIQDFIKDNYMKIEFSKENILKNVDLHTWEEIEKKVYNLVLYNDSCEILDKENKSNVSMDNVSNVINNTADNVDSKPDTNSADITPNKNLNSDLNKINNENKLDLILNLWHDTWQQYFIIPKLNNDLQFLLNSIKSEQPDMEKWNKLKNLKNEILKQKTNIKKD